MLKVVTKDMFLDRKRVIDRLEKKEARILARTGGFTRKAMQRSMRYKKAVGGKPSEAGKPPKARRNFPLLRERIAFGLDGDSVAIGPLVNTNKTGKTRKRKKNRVNVPELLNQGGTARVVLPGGEEVRAKYLPRPFATDESPAFVAGQQKFLELTESIPL